MKRTNTPTLDIVIPCYNEEDVLPETIKQLSHMYQTLLVKQQISQKIFLDEVYHLSSDRTKELETVLSLTQRDINA